MNELALFAGAGGGILGGQLLGWRTVCAVEYEPYAAAVLAQRQNDGLLPPFPIWDDVRTFDGRPWHGRVDVVSGGFPCQDISLAGKGAGLSGERSGLWSEFSRIIREVSPRFVFVENSPALTSRGLGTVLGDLAAMGFDARWGVLGASDVGAPHIRKRIWIVANASSGRLGRAKGWQVEQPRGTETFSTGATSYAERQPLRNATGKDLEPKEPIRAEPRLHGCHRNVAYANCTCREQSENEADASASRWASRDAIGWDGWWITEPDVGRVADGVAARMDRLKALGNGQVPQCAAVAFELLSS